jgi:hypothetical protein
VEVWLLKCPIAGGFRFGIVPEKAVTWPRKPQESHAEAHCIDGLGRLWRPGGSRGVKELYGERLAEGDCVGLLVRPCGDHVLGQFQRNERTLGDAFRLPRDQAFLPVVYFSAMQDPSLVQIGLSPPTMPRQISNSSEASTGLVVREFARDPEVFEHTPCSPLEYNQLTVEDLAQMLARRLSHGLWTVFSSQVDVLVDGWCVEDKSVRLMDLVTYKNGVLLEDLHWSVQHLVS